MELLTPGFGLFFWQLFVFLILFFLLAKFAWRPILDSLKVREESIEEALLSAENAREEMTKLQSSNQQLLDEGRQERDKIIKDATTAASKLVEAAKDNAAKEGKRMIEDAKQAIQIEKHAAIKDVKKSGCYFILRNY